jgi:PAS domain S-box-containing protein
MSIDRDIIETPALPLGAVFDAAMDAVIVARDDGRIHAWNPAAEELFGISREAALGVPVEELIIPGPLREAHRNGIRRYLATRESAILGRRIELSALHSDGHEFPVELTLVAVDADQAVYFLGFVRDLRERRQAHLENQRLSQRMAFLAQAGLVLDRSLEASETLRGLAELAVPELAGLAVIDLLGGDGRVQSAVAATADASRAREVERTRLEHPITGDASHPVAEVLRSGQPLLLPAMTDGFLAAIATDPGHLSLMRRMRYHSAIVVPLVARRRVLGTLSLLRMEGAPSYDQDDLVLAEELGRRAALAIDNNRLFAVTRDVARTLQESLLPEALPEIPNGRLAAAYRAVAEGQVLGGDFYDAFQREDGSWALVIGDVCGKGPEAAALTALARHTIRALADLPPAEALGRLNRLVYRDQLTRSQRFLTATVTQIWPGPGTMELELATGGHPPSLVLRADGRTEALPAAGPLVGIFPEQDFRPVKAELAIGDSLVLYTDGLTDAAAPARVLGADELLAILGECAGMTPQQIVAHLQARAVGSVEPRDDIALIVLQVSDD